MNELNKKSILQMAKGAIQERVDSEVNRVVDNILDERTLPNAKRKIVLTIEMIPDLERTTIETNIIAKSTLAPAKPVSTELAITADENGEVIIAEMSPEVSGQMDFNGGFEEEPNILKFARML